MVVGVCYLSRKPWKPFIVEYFRTKNRVSQVLNILKEKKKFEVRSV